ncbi:MAG: PASTA domain-containing protein, partial [Actinomycetes bacterium]
LAPAQGDPPTRRINGRGTPPPMDEYDDYYDERPRRSTGKTIGIVLGVLVALGLVGFVAFQVFSGPPAAQVVVVPTVTGLPENDARTQILAAGLRIGEVTTRDSTVEERGRVVETSPGVGTEVDERTVVTMVVGGGPASVRVPLLEGRTVTEATDILEEEGLVLGTQEEQETPDPSKVGKIISSTPRAGESAKGGSEVAVVVGKQQTGVQIPDLSGYDLDDAEQELRKLGLKPEFSDGSDENDRVSGTNPPAGTKVQPGSEVEILTGDSSGGDIRMPNVEGLPLAQAKDRLAEEGIRSIQTREQQVSNPDEDGEVIAQSVEPGERVSSSQTITLIVGEATGGGLTG